MALQERFDASLVLEPVERTGGVDQTPARSKQLCRPVEDLGLTARAARRRAGTPFRARGRFTAEHSLAGARRVDEHRVEPLRPARGQRLRIGAHRDGVHHAEALEVLRQYARPRGHRLVAHQHAPPAHRRGDLGGLAARRGAEVEDALARPGAEHGGGQHRARLLKVERAAGVRERRPRAHARPQVEAALRPRHRIAAKLRRGRVRPEAKRVDPKRERRLALQRCEKIIQFGAEQRAHLFYESFRKHANLSPCRFCAGSCLDFHYSILRRFPQARRDARRKCLENP